MERICSWLASPALCPVQTHPAHSVHAHNNVTNKKNNEGNKNARTHTYTHLKFPRRQKIFLPPVYQLDVDAVCEVTCNLSRCSHVTATTMIQKLRHFQRRGGNIGILGGLLARSL